MKPKSKAAQKRIDEDSEAMLQGLIAAEADNAFAVTSFSIQEPTQSTTAVESSNPKRVANRQQTGSKQVAKTGSKQVAAKKPVTDRIIETGSTTGSKESPNRQQTGSKQVANVAVFESLVGHEKWLLLLIFRECSRVGSLVSPELTLSYITEVLKCTPGTAKSAINRLIEKGFTSRVLSKTGRGGWIKFGLSKDLYRDLRIRETDSKEVANRQQTDSKEVAQRVAEQIAEAPCSSSVLNSEKILTTTEPDFWLSVPRNLDGLVSIKQLRDFVKQGLVSAEELQTSLDGFAFDLEKGAVKAKNGNPLAILIGAIKGGGYISQSYLSELKASLAEVEKTRAEMQRIRAENVVEKIKEEFEKFRTGFPEEAEKLKPVGSFMNSFQPGGIGYRMWIEEYKRQKESDQNQNVGEPNP